MTGRLEDEWEAWDADVGRIRRITRAPARLRYSFMNNWSEPVKAIARMSRKHPSLCFVLAGVETWTMPDDLANRYGELDVDGLYEESQPRVMRKLVRHWQPEVNRWLAGAYRQRRGR
jgi:hypothetical protein